MGFFSKLKNRLIFQTRVERLMIDILEIRREVHPAFAKDITKSTVKWAEVNGFLDSLDYDFKTAAFICLAGIIESRCIGSTRDMKLTYWNLYGTLIKISSRPEHQIANDVIEKYKVTYEENCRLIRDA